MNKEGQARKEKDNVCRKGKKAAVLEASKKKRVWNFPFLLVQTIR